MNTLPHIRCYSCGKVLGNYENRLNRLTTKSFSLDEALIASGYSEYIPNVKQLIEQGYNYMQAMKCLNIDTNKVLGYMFMGPTLGEVMKLLGYKYEQYEQVKQLMEQGMTLEEALSVLQIDSMNILHILRNGMTIGQAMDYLDIKRTCCRMNLMNPIVIPLGAGVKLKEAENYVNLEAPLQALASTMSNLTINTPVRPMTTTPKSTIKSRSNLVRLTKRK